MNVDNLLEQIKTEKIPCYFISPHLDDAVLSAGALMAELTLYTRVEVVTVVTKGSPRPYTLSAWAFLRQCGKKNVDALFRERQEEDIRACAVAGITPLHLGYVDALWRKITKPNLLRRILGRFLSEFLHVYPTHRIHIVKGEISPNDSPMRENLTEKLTKITEGQGNFLVFCPLALRTHVDHVLVRDVCLAHFSRVVLWTDFPYCLRSPASKEEVSSMAVEAFHFVGGMEVKLRMIREYASQVTAMFPDGNIPLVSEYYFLPKSTKNGHID